MKDKKRYKILGTLLLIGGIALMARALINFFISASRFEPPNLFFLGFIGIPLILFGVAIRQSANGKTNGNHVNKNEKSEDLFNDTQKSIPNNYTYRPKNISNNKPKESAIDKSIKNNNGHRIKCRFCSQVNKPGEQYCEKCGTRLSLVCKRCNTANEISETKCRNCGKRF